MGEPVAAPQWAAPMTPPPVAGPADVVPTARVALPPGAAEVAVVGPEDFLLVRVPPTMTDEAFRVYCDQVRAAAPAALWARMVVLVAEQFAVLG